MDMKNYKRFSFKMAHDLWKTTCYYLVVPMKADGFVDACNGFLIPKDEEELVKALAYLPFERIDYYVAEIKEIYDGRRDNIAFVHERDVSYIVNGAFYSPLEEYMDLRDKVKNYRCDSGKDIVVMELSEVFDEGDLLEIMHVFCYYVYRTLSNIKATPISETVVSDEIINILSAFEELLQEKDVVIPCCDPDEELEREACLYGMEYYDMLGAVEHYVSKILKAHGLIEKEVDENGNN